MQDNVLIPCVLAAVAATFEFLIKAWIMQSSWLKLRVDGTITPRCMQLYGSAWPSEEATLKITISFTAKTDQNLEKSFLSLENRNLFKKICKSTHKFRDFFLERRHKKVSILVGRWLLKMESYCWVKAVRRAHSFANLQNAHTSSSLKVWECVCLERSATNKFTIDSTDRLIIRWKGLRAQFPSGGTPSHQIPIVWSAFIDSTWQIACEFEFVFSFYATTWMPSLSILIPSANRRIPR